MNSTKTLESMINLFRDGRIFSKKTGVTVGGKRESLWGTACKYLDQRAESNDAYRLATYTVTAIMFNHLISAFDAFIETRRRLLAPNTESAMGLTFSPFARSGVGGISLAIRW